MYFKLILFNKNVLPFSQKNFKKSFPFAVTHKCWSHGTSKSSTAFLKKIKKKKFSFCCHAQMLFSWHFKVFNPVFLPFKKKKKKKKLIMSYFLIALNPYVMPLSLHYIFFFLQSFDLFIVSTCEIFLQT